MNYNICTVANEAYLNFLYYFTKSALEKCKDLKKLYILYTGENFPDDPIYNNEKITILKHNSIILTKNIWDEGWLKNVDLKSKFLKFLSVETPDPLFLIDVDCYFLTEFIEEIDLSSDLIFCLRDHFVPYIGSFVGLIHPEKCIEFIDLWRKNIESIKTVPKETPALVSTIKYLKEKNMYKIQEIKDTIISCAKLDPIPNEAKILHFKGGRIGDVNEMLNKRLEKLKSIL